MLDQEMERQVANMSGKRDSIHFICHCLVEYLNRNLIAPESDNNYYDFRVFISFAYDLS